jgi:hypothetical protein
MESSIIGFDRGKSWNPVKQTISGFAHSFAMDNSRFRK